jgi:hypothetical protein
MVKIHLQIMLSTFIKAISRDRHCSAPKRRKKFNESRELGILSAMKDGHVEVV